MADADQKIKTRFGDCMAISESSLSMVFVFVLILATWPGLLTTSPVIANTKVLQENGDTKPDSSRRLNQGITVTGRVTDPAGQNVDGALVRTKFLNDRRQATTGMDGTYELKDCESGEARIVVSAPGFALDMKKVRIASDLKPVDFQLQRGGKVRVKVLDEKNNPISGARIFFQRWRGRIDYFEFDHVRNTRTDKNGIWEWDEAPLDEFFADIGRPGGMSLPEQRMKAGEPEFVFRPPPQLYVSGSVVDKTGTPVKSFRVIPGIEGTSSRNLVEAEAIDASDGKFRLKHLSHGYNAHFVRIEADGYDPVESRDINLDEGEVTVDFKLKRGTNIAAQVLAPDGKPAKQATVSLGVERSQISIDNGRLDLSSNYNSPNQKTDAEGKFSFPPRSTDFQLVILHDAGFAHVKANSKQLPKQIELTAWATIEGILKAGDTSESEKTVTLLGEGIHSYGDGVPNIFTHNNAQTGVDGRFLLRHVVPGEYRIGKSVLITVDDGAKDADSVRYERIVVVAGETTNVVLGGSGRSVIGRLAPAPDFAGKPLWSFAKIQIATDLNIPEVPFPENIRADRDKRADWFAKWRNSPAGIERETLVAKQRNSPSFLVTVASDGAFLIQDIPPGNYLVNFTFDQHFAGQILGYQLTVEESAEDEPVDLGTITLLPVQW